MYKDWEPDLDFVASVIYVIQLNPSQSHLAQLLVVEGEHARVLTIKLHLRKMFTMMTKTMMTMISLRKKFTFTTGRGLAVVKSPWHQRNLVLF